MSEKRHGSVCRGHDLANALHTDNAQVRFESNQTEEMQEWIEVMHLRHRYKTIIISKTRIYDWKERLTLTIHAAIPAKMEQVHGTTAGLVGHRGN